MSGTTDAMRGPSRRDRLLIAGLILGGLVIFLTGAGLASTLDAWGLVGVSYLQAVAAGSADAWRVGNQLLAIGVIVTAAGLVALGGALGSAAARAGAALGLVAASLGALGFLIQGHATLAAADILRATGDIPAAFLVIDALHEDGLLYLYAGLGMLGTALLGISAIRVPWLPAAVGPFAAAAGLFGAVVIFLGFALIPAVVQVVAAILGVGVALSRGSASNG
jgi:hypothetical protein